MSPFLQVMVLKEDKQGRITAEAPLCLPFPPAVCRREPMLPAEHLTSVALWALSPTLHEQQVLSSSVQCHVVSELSLYL